MSAHSSSFTLPHTRSEDQIHNNYSLHNRTQRSGYNTPTSAAQSTHTNSLLFSISPRQIYSSRDGRSSMNQALYDHSRNSARGDISMYSSSVAANLASAYAITRGSSDSSSSVSFAETLDTSPRSRMTDFRFPLTNVECQLQRKYRPDPLNSELTRHSSTPALCNSGGRSPLPGPNIYIGAPAAQQTELSRMSHWPACAAQTYILMDDTPETPRTRVNIMRNVTPLFAMINSRAAAIGVTTTLDGDLIFQHK